MGVGARSAKSASLDLRIGRWLVRAGLVGDGRIDNAPETSGVGSGSPQAVGRVCALVTRSGCKCSSRLAALASS
ncbi:hypothetical protein B1987_11345 [Mycobacterium kansasii]|nr:hypothetical protein B1987_11345 [Mycobacterium kansasii]